jgi:NodT family efflux transporter outer membrane factor (OMF) lipoprotein
MHKKIHLKYSRLCYILLAGSLICSLLLNCSPETRKVRLPVETPEAFSDSGNQLLQDRWWTVFEDSALNAWVDSALHSNFNLKAVWQRLREAQAVVDRESAGFFPDLSVFLFGQTTQSDLPDYQRWEAGFESQYEIDLWGRIQAGVAAEKYREDAGYADYQAAAISLSAEMASSWYRLADARSQVTLINRQIETNKKILNLIKIRFGSGKIRSVDILRQRELLEATNEQKIAAETRVQVLEHQFAVLTGNAPGYRFTVNRVSLPELPPVPETGLPADLIRRRPDVQRAFHLLLAADRDLAAAISNQYPRLSISAAYSSASTTTGSLFKEWAGSLSGNLLAPIFNAGALSAEVDRSEAVKMQRLNQYAQTVLTAFQEVEDALILEKKQSERIRSIEQQIDFARQTLESLRNEYLNGMSNYLDILIALTNEQQLRRDLLSARLNLLEFRIALYRALAGGFETQREPERGG